VNPDQARTAVAEALYAIAPDVEFNDLDPDEGLRRQADLDSLDFLSFVEVLAERTGAQLTENDYPALDSVTGAVNLLTTRTHALG
jgi:acyl carrier protein